MRRIAKTLLISTVLAAAAIGATAFAADSDGGSQQSQNTPAMQGQQMSHGEFTGEVVGVRTATFANGKKYKLVKIRSRKDDVAVLNLGPVKNLKSRGVEVQEGEYIQASGVSGRINGKPVLVVYRLSMATQGNNKQGNSGQASNNRSDDSQSTSQ